jgi:hypothetical protein
MCAGQTFSTLTRFVENACNIYIYLQISLLWKYIQRSI